MKRAEKRRKIAALRDVLDRSRYTVAVCGSGMMEEGGFVGVKLQERAGKLQTIITANIYELSQQAGCTNVVNLHGTIYDNECPHCKKKFPVEVIIESKGVPHCDVCGTIIRPNVALFGEQLDSQLVARATLEIEKADVLLVLGTTLKSEVFAHYIRYFEGSHLVIIHKTPHHMDDQANLVIIDHPMNVLPNLGY